MIVLGFTIAGMVCHGIAYRGRSAVFSFLTNQFLTLKPEKKYLLPDSYSITVGGPV